MISYKLHRSLEQAPAIPLTAVELITDYFKRSRLDLHDAEDAPLVIATKESQLAVLDGRDAYTPQTRLPFHRREADGQHFAMLRIPMSDHWEPQIRRQLATEW